MKLPHSKLFQDNNRRLIASFKKKAVIIKFNVTSALVDMPSTADIYFLDNPQTIIKGVPVSDSVRFVTSAISQAGVLSNKKCVVDVFDESNAQQMIVAYTY